MKAKLEVKNFGPIKDVTLDLRSVNVIIGKQASGKSTLAKLYTICDSPIYFLDISEDVYSNQINLESPEDHLSLTKFHESLVHFSLEDYLQENSFIVFESDSHIVKFEHGKISFSSKLQLKKLLNSYNDDINNFFSEIDDLRNRSWNFNLDFIIEICKPILVKYKFSEPEIFERYRKLTTSELFLAVPHQQEDIISVLKRLQNQLLFRKVNYIPTERNFVPILKRSSLNLQRLKIPIPPHLLDFAGQYEFAINDIRDYKLDFINKNTSYKNVNGEERIFYSETNSVKLSAGSSGIQSFIPLILVYENLLAKTLYHNRVPFVIEEPETNLFPDTQVKLIELLESKRKLKVTDLNHGTFNFYTTHSPYILSALNNLLYAYKIGSDLDINQQNRISKLIPKESWINSNDFSAYEIKNGRAKSIFRRRIGLVDENIIDSVSDKIMDEFRNLALIKTKLEND